ncbi:hypothetical protein CFAM422_009641 [Trichoderma lentiforme]|uniref:Uncharacterized protein n=1 Tax=Trichoderma lentiforme TaxID=1567552 RepID=A0A9P5CAD5_9HYPO|nr:hypothetical protein CFAM422_009641 [Trichoderma lentiforme]
MTTTLRLSASHEMQCAVMSLDQLTFRLYAFTLTNGIDAKTPRSEDIPALARHTLTFQGSSGETLSASPRLTLVSCCYCKKQTHHQSALLILSPNRIRSNSFTTSFSCSPPDLTLFRLLKLQTDSWLSSNEKLQDELQFSKQCLHSNSDSHGLLCHVTGTDRAAAVFVSTEHQLMAREQKWSGDGQMHLLHAFWAAKLDSTT